MKNRGTKTFHWWDYHHDWQPHSGDVIEELTLTIYVNGEEFVSMMGTPLNQDWLAVGFLMNEGILEDLDEIKDIKVTKDGCCIDVWLDRNVDLPQKMVLTSGCGGGLTQEDSLVEIEPLPVGIITDPDYDPSRHLHTCKPKKAFMPEPAEFMPQACLILKPGSCFRLTEDIGRHNAIDKLHGACLMQGIKMEGRALITTGGSPRKCSVRERL